MNVTTVFNPHPSLIGELYTRFSKPSFYHPSLFYKSKTKGDVVCFIVDKDNVPCWYTIAYLRKFPGIKILEFVTPFTLPFNEEHIHQFNISLIRVCEEQSISQVSLPGFCSSATPPLLHFGTVDRQVQRYQYCRNLTDDLSEKTFKKNHQRNIVKAIRKGVSLSVGHSQEFVSMHRQISHNQTLINDEIRILLQMKQATVLHALWNGTCVSSLLLVHSGNQAIYHSGGTSEEGRELGVSYWLMWQAMLFAKNLGCTSFDLGGVTENDRKGLARFKAGFNTNSWPAFHRQYAIQPIYRSRLINTLRDLRSAPIQTTKRIFSVLFDFHEWQCFRRSIPFPPDSFAILPEWDIRMLDPEEILRLSEANSDLLQQSRYLTMYHSAVCFGLYVRGEIAHISWLIEYKNQFQQHEYPLQLDELHCEITHCVTIEKFRGLGLYQTMIQYLCNFALQAGSETVFMITESENKTSRHSIEKCGFQHIGLIKKIKIPIVNKDFYYRSLRPFTTSM